MKILIVVALLCAFVLTTIQVIKQQMVRTLCRMGAVKVYGELRSLFAGEHEYRKSERADFEDLDFEAYDSVAEVLTARQFRRLGAAEDLTVSKVHPARRTTIELWVDPGGATLVATYQVDGVQISDVFSQATNGRCFLTTNAELDKLTPPPSVERLEHPAGAPIATLVSTHAERLGHKDIAESGLSFLRFHSFEDAIDSMRSHTRVVSEYRRSLGYLTEPELEAMVSTPEEGGAAKVLWQEFRKLSGDQSRAA